MLKALEEEKFGFDVVALHRRHPRRRYYPCVRLTGHHTAGRVRYSDSGAEGLVITQRAARYFLETTPKMVLSSDHAILRHWTNGLNVFYVDPPVVHHGGYEGTFIGTSRSVSSRYEPAANYTIGPWRRAVTGVARGVSKYLAFRKQVRADGHDAALPLAKRA